MAGLFSALGATSIGKWFSSQFKNLNLGNLLPWFGSLGAGAAVHARNTQLMREQNAFNAGEAQLNRNFQAQEAALARQWQEDFYLKYQSPQAMVHQYEAAGLNPVLSTGMPTNTPPSASSAQGSMAQGASAPYLDATGIMQQFMGLMKLDAEISNIKADTKEKEQQVHESASRESLNRTMNELSKAQQEEVQNRAALLAAQAKTEKAKEEFLVVEKAVKEMQQNQLSYDVALSKAFEEHTGMKASASTITSLMTASISALGNLAGNFLKFTPKSK